VELLIDHIGQCKMEKKIKQHEAQEEDCMSLMDAGV